MVFSAHWEAAAPVRVTSGATPRTIHDFSGFPAALYELTYPAPGAPALAREIAGLIGGESDPRRGFDHGVWIPLRLAFPQADIPVIAVSLPRPRSPEGLVGMGKALRPLRERGMLLVGSGGTVHNFSEIRFESPDAPVDPWARDFEERLMKRVEALDAKNVIADPRAAPTTEHFDPLYVVLGAAVPGDRVRTVYEGFRYGNLSMRTFEIGSA